VACRGAPEALSPGNTGLGLSLASAQGRAMGRCGSGSCVTSVIGRAGICVASRSHSAQTQESQKHRTIWGLHDFSEQLREAVCCQPPSAGLSSPLRSFPAPRLASSLSASGWESPMLMRSRGNPPHDGGFPLLLLFLTLILCNIRDDSCLL
jgi:hypothetical protein